MGDAQHGFSASVFGPRVARLSGAFGACALYRGLRRAGMLLVLGLGLAAPGLAGAVDVNNATVEQLRTVRGIGPKTAQTIVDERARGGRYESFDDLSERVKGIGPKKSASLQASGLTLSGAGGQAATPAAAAASTGAATAPGAARARK